jgi:hypothetical protein
MAQRQADAMHLQKQRKQKQRKQKQRKQKRHPDCSAMAFKLLPDCPLRWAQYFITLQSVLHVMRAPLLPFLVSANLAFPQGPSAQSNQLV